MTKIKWNKRFDYPKSMRSMIKGKRHYDINKNNKKLPSVTTILGQTQSKEKQDSLARWRDKVGVNTRSLCKWYKTRRSYRIR